MEALPVREVVDTEGAGDCFTATFINAVAESGLTLSSIPAAIREAMENASRSVGYFGSKGFIREGKKAESLKGNEILGVYNKESIRSSLKAPTEQARCHGGKAMRNVQFKKLMSFARENS